MDVRFLQSGKQAVVDYKLRDDANVSDNKTNLCIAGLTTCYARLELYKYLDILQESVLYFDTDSVFFVQPTGRKPLIPSGSNLGCMRDEIAVNSCIDH